MCTITVTIIITTASLATPTPRPPTGKYARGRVYVLPKVLDEKVARLHLGSLGVELTELSQEQAEYIGVNVTGPYKPEAYRY